MASEILVQETIRRPTTRLQHADIDSVICREIDFATSENSNIWTCPDFNRREYIHCFFQYPAMMVPAVQKKLIEIIVSAKPSIQNMLDPFMGSATTLVACMENGLNCYGQDINPLAVLIAKARTGPYFVDAIKQKLSELLKRVNSDNSNRIDANFSGLHKWFKNNTAIELSKLSRAIKLENRLAVRRFFWVVLAETVRLTSNDRTSTFKLHKRPDTEIDQRNVSPLLVFELHAERSIEDYELHANLLKKNGQLVNGTYKSTVEIKLLDSKKEIYYPQNTQYDLLVTSPPYGDNKTTVTYGQHSYLPLQWIDLKDIDSKANKEFLRTTSEIDTRSIGGKLAEMDKTKIKSLFDISPTFKSTYEEIAKTSPDKVKKVGGFMFDLNKTIDNSIRAMKTNSYQIWTVGNRRVGGIEVPNDQIISELIQNKGCNIVKKLEREILNKRMAKRNKETSLMNTEDILIFRKIGKE